jgi:hypothetical protein
LPQISKERTKSSYEHLQKVGENKWKYTHTNQNDDWTIDFKHQCNGRAKNMKEDNFYSMQRFEHQKHKRKQAYTIDWFWLKCKRKYNFYQLTNLECLKHEGMQINFVE